MKCLAEVYVSFWVGDIVFLRVAADRCAGMVTGVLFRPNGVIYDVTWEHGGDSYHYAIELTSEFLPGDWPTQGDDGAEVAP